MKIAKRLSLITFLLLGFVQTTAARHRGPVPVTPAERAFFAYIEDVSKISLADGIPAHPWVECDDQEEKSTFFSASLNQFYDPQNPHDALQSWLTSFLDHAYWARVKSATCLYEANHFNECFARGSFRVIFRSKRIIGFKEKTKERYCNSSLSSAKN